MTNLHALDRDDRGPRVKLLVGVRLWELDENDVAKRLCLVSGRQKETKKRSEIYSKTREHRLGKGRDKDHKQTPKKHKNQEKKRVQVLEFTSCAKSVIPTVTISPGAGGPSCAVATYSCLAV
jgi:hypothetical protein